MTAEFFGIEPDPGRRPFIPADGPRKLSVQITVAVRDIERAEDHQERMAELAARAVGVFARSGLQVDWHTLAFRVDRTGMELLPDDQLWRWEVWAK